MAQAALPAQSKRTDQGTAYKILFIIGLVHLLNDSIQSVIPAMFPVLEKSMGLTYTQLGLIAFSLNIVSSVMQPVIGFMSDKKPMPFALPAGLGFTMFGVMGLAFAPSFGWIIVSVLFIGLGSAVFHPEGSRVAYFAAGSRRGLAQSIYQVGGNAGQALAPLITALILVPLGQRGAAIFSVVAALAVALLIYIAVWYSKQLVEFRKSKPVNRDKKEPDLKIKKAIRHALLLIIFLIFARTWYISGMTNFYSFYSIEKYSLSIREAQIFLFVFLLAGAVGTFFGGPLADRFGKKKVIFFSMLGTAPLSAVLPFVPSTAAIFLLAICGFILMTSFSVTVVYAQELVPGRIGTMAGLTVGLAFGMGAIGSVALGFISDLIGLRLTICLAGFLPLLGIITLLLPSDQKLASWHSSQ